MNSDDAGKAAPLITTAGTAWILIGIVGGLIIATLGLPLSKGLHLSDSNRSIAATVFALTGASFLCDRALALTTAVLSGLRRFDLTNSLATLAALVRAIGIIVLLKTGSGVVAVMVWQGVSTLATAVAGQFMIRHLQPDFRFRVGSVHWSLLRSRLAIGLASQLTSIVEIMIWDIAPLVVGLVLGSKWIVVYYIAQQFPISLGPVISSTAEALFPAASQHRGDRAVDRMCEILEVGTRWIVVLALPLCMGLWIVAPKLLQAWVGTVPEGAILCLRLITLAVFMEGFSAASIQVLWGRSAIRTLVIIPCVLLAASLELTLLLLPRIGIVGAAWGLAIPMCIASLVYLHIGARTCGIRATQLARTTFASLVVPVLAFLAICISLNYLTGPGWFGVLAATVAGGLAYLITFLWLGAREEELILARKLFEILRALFSGPYRRLRHSLASLDFLRSGYFLLLTIREAVQDSPARGQAELDHEFGPGEDPWNYTTAPFQTDRIRREVEMVDSVRGTRLFAQALEVGCAEGLFTEALAPRCESLLAADISRVALARAQRRLQTFEQIQFAHWDLRVDPVPALYDLIVIVHALEYIRNPLYIRRARTKLVNALRPGGYLLMGTMKVADIYEDAWWGRISCAAARESTISLPPIRR